MAALFAGLSPVINRKAILANYEQSSYSHRAGSSLNRKFVRHSIAPSWKLFTSMSTVSPVLSDLEDDLVVASENVSEPRELKIGIGVSGERTQVIFDDVFSKLVAAAQPIPGFRRIKGGTTPDIPWEILLQILGPSKVNQQAIKKVINIAVSEIVEKEGMNVTSNLKIEESYEELEANFGPGREFSFTAILELCDTAETNA